MSYLEVTPADPLDEDSEPFLYHEWDKWQLSTENDWQQVHEQDKFWYKLYDYEIAFKQPPCQVSQEEIDLRAKQVTTFNLETTIRGEPDIQSLDTIIEKANQIFLDGSKHWCGKVFHTLVWTDNG